LLLEPLLLTAFVAVEGDADERLVHVFCKAKQPQLLLFLLVSMKKMMMMMMSTMRSFLPLHLRLTCC